MPEIDDCQRFVDRVIGSRWWKNRFPNITDVRARDGRGHSAIAKPGPFTIRLPKSLRTKWTILHELAHFATPWRHAAHGPEFARNYLELVRRFLGPAAARKLRETFELCYVRVQRV